MQDKVSIIVPVYNQKREWLNRAVDSVKAQDYKNIECILIDDGSTDDTGEYCDKLAEEYEKIIVLHQQNTRQGGARNNGLDHATGKYIFFLDSDDWILPNTISRLVSLIKEYNAQIAVCGCFKQTSDGVIHKPELKEETITVLNRFQAYESYVFDTEFCNHSPCDKLYDISVFNGERFIEHSYYEDLGSIYKFVRHADKIVHTDMPLYCYFDNLNSTMHTPFSVHEVDKVKNYYDLCEFFRGFNDEKYNPLLFRLNQLTMYAAIYYVSNAYKRPLTDTIKKGIKRTKNICKKLRQPISKKLNILRRLIVFSPKLFSFLWNIYYKKSEVQT